MVTGSRIASASSSRADRTTTHNELRRHFAQRLRAAMESKGWTQARTVQEVRHFLGEGERFGAAHMSHYLNGRAIPQMSYLRALSRALEVSEERLLGGTARKPPQQNDDVVIVDPDPQGALRGRRTSAQVRDADEGEAWLEVNERVPWETALEILRLLKGGKGRGS